MGDKTGIEWTDATWNPVTGCDRTSPGCDNCYALKQAARLKRMGSANYQNDGDPRTSGPGFGVTCHPHMLDQPLRWKRPRRIFVNSMSDLFHPAVPDEFIATVFAVMAVCPQHTFQVLTKRPQRMASLLKYDASPETGSSFTMLVHDEVERLGHREACYDDFPLPNVWLGVSIENDRYTFRADHLRATPAAVRFISAEPLLGPLPSLNLTGIDWLIVGGESGPDARPMHPDWARDLRDRCQLPELNDAWPGDRHTAFHFKQWGEYGPVASVDNAGAIALDGRRHKEWTDYGHGDHHARVGKHAAGRVLDGHTWDEFPVVKV